MEKQKACKELKDSLSDLQTSLHFFAGQLENKIKKQPIENDFQALKDDFQFKLVLLEEYWHHFLINFPSGKKFEDFIANSKKEVFHSGHIYKIGQRLTLKMIAISGEVRYRELEIVGFSLERNNPIFKFVDDHSDGFTEINIEDLPAMSKK